MSDPVRQRGLAAYIAFFEALTPQMLAQLDSLTAEDVHFKDPFNDVRGRSAFAAVLRHMLATCQDLRFAVTHRAWDGDIAFLRWRFTAHVPRLGAWDIVGISELTVGADGRISVHIDYWDAGAHVYARIPLLGAAVRALRRRLATPAA